jgi:cbb3-type cytochrome oxidase subunit 3
VPGARLTVDGGLPEASATGLLAQAASIPTIRPVSTKYRSRFMGLLLLEALGALLLLLLIVWWTMFSGRKRGELQQEESSDEKEDAAASPAPQAQKLDKTER